MAEVGHIGGVGARPRYAPTPRSPAPSPATTVPTKRLLRSVRALGERAAAELKQALKPITLSPERIGAIAQAALVLNNARK